MIGSSLTDCLGLTHRRSRMRAEVRPQADKFAGGHRSRVTPVPIPNTEFKPATADGTARETVWESRSLPAFIRTTSSMRRVHASGFLLVPVTSSRIGPFVCTIAHGVADRPRAAR